MELLTLEEAGHIMGVSAERARQLALGGRLQAIKKGGRWLVPSEAAHARIKRPRVGRPLSSRVAWQVIAAAQSGANSAASEGRDALVASAYELRRLREVVSSAPPVEQWSWWLRGRAESRAFWVHPGLLERIRQDHRVVLAGAWAAAANGSQLRPPEDSLEVYVERSLVAELVAEFRMTADVDASNVRMRVVEHVVDVADLGATVRCVSDVVAAIDLVESPEARLREWSYRVLKSAHTRLLEVVLSPESSAASRG